MQSFFDKRMGAGWKISFVISVLVLVINAWDEFGGRRRTYLTGEELFTYSLPLIIWLTARWLAISKGSKDERGD